MNTNNQPPRSSSDRLAERMAKHSLAQLRPDFRKRASANPVLKALFG
jgi:hypothetical protein